MERPPDAKKLAANQAEWFDAFAKMDEEFAREAIPTDICTSGDSAFCADTVVAR